jgi:COP9 signalosome complex subunit 12
MTGMIIIFWHVDFWLIESRAPLEESRKWGIYFVINLLFKTYFKLNSASLSRTILKTLAVYNDKGDMPPLEMFPKSQRVTFKFYEGVLLFLEENYNKVSVLLLVKATV